MYLSIFLILFLHSYSDAFNYLTLCRIHMQTMHQNFSLFHSNIVKIVEIFLFIRFLYCIDNYYIWPHVFCWKIHVIVMFNFSPIIMAKMTTTTNDVAMQNMFLLIDNIVPHRTYLKPRGMILNESANFYLFLLQHMGHQPW